MAILPAKPLPEDCMLPLAPSLQPQVTQVTLMILINAHLQVIPVYSEHQIELKLTVFNDDGLMFDNFTSLKWKWQSSSPTHLSTKDHMISLSHQGNHGNHLILCMV